MKAGISFLFLISCSLTFGQSARKINRQLTSELAVLKSEYDSVTVFGFKKFIRASD